MKHKKSKFNLIFPLAVTFILMVLVVIYTSRLFYRIAVSNIYEVGEDKISGISASLGNYLDTTKSVLWVTADTVDFMVSNGESNQEILDYLVLETQRHKSQFDKNYTGLYGYINGEYLDGLGWEPPEGYDPTQRDWYKLAIKSKGELVIVPPYVDAQTGSMVISVDRVLSDGENVVSLDLYTNHIQEVIDNTNIKGKGYGFIISKDGTIISHKDKKLNGEDYSAISGGKELMKNLSNKKISYSEITMDGKDCTVFSQPIMDQWYVVIVVPNEDLFTEVQSQMLVSIAIFVIVFVLIALFYCIAYRNEQKSYREAEALKISEQQKEYEAELLKFEKSAADAANKAKGDFLAQMSHEIRTPINAVLGMNEMILYESEDRNILGYAENIQTAGRTLLSLINSILDFSKIEDGKMEIIPIQYNTVTMINNLVNSVHERAVSKGLEFIVNADPKLPRMLTGDDVRLSQIIMNLLSNAVKYTENGSVTFSVAAKEMTETSVILAVEVRDTGIGIHKEDMEKMFESFSRLDETRNRNIEGTGLGMAIVTKLLALMDSELKVESEYGKGSAFSFEIKQEIADAEPIGDINRRHTAPGSSTKKEKIHFKGANVLVTDDNELNLQVATNLLKLFGIHADTAASGMKTIEMMKHKQYDIVFLDHMMPKMDGIETLTKLREEGLIPKDTAVIALTANAVIGAKEAYIEAGFDGYLSKPIELDSLEQTLMKHLLHKAEARTTLSIPDIPPAETASPQKEENELITQLRSAGIDPDSGLAYCADDLFFYREMLSEYASSGSSRLEELKQDLKNGDTDSYRIHVHALKSASKTVGADDISELAKKLEDAAKTGDEDFIRKHSDELSESLRTRAQKLRAILGI